MALNFSGTSFTTGNPIASTNTTLSSSATTGALTLTGGVGHAIAATSTSGTFFGNILTYTNTPASSSTTSIFGAEVYVKHAGTQTQGTNDVVSIYSLAENNSSANFTSNLIGLRAKIQNTGAGVLTAGYGLYVDSPTVSAGSITTAYGIFINTQSAAGTNYALFTNGAGLVKISDTTISTGTGTGSIQGSGSLSLAPGSITTSTTNYGVISITTHTPGASSTALLYGGLFEIDFNGAGANTGNVSYGVAGVSKKVNTGNITELVGVYGRVHNTNATGTVTNGKGVHIETPVVTGTITNDYGLYIADQNVGGTLNYAIYTNAGIVRLGDSTASTSTTSGGVQLSGGIGVADAINVGASSTMSANKAGTLDWKSTNSNTGTAAQAGFSAINDAATTLQLVSEGSGRTGTRWGIAVGNYAELYAFGASCNGLMIGLSNIDKPLIFGINASEVARFTGGTLSTGSMTISYTTASTSTATGGLVLSGGLGVAGNGYFGGIVNVPLGAANAPTYSINGTTTGLYSSGTNKLDFTTASTRAGGIDASGNWDVAIGTFTVSSGRISQLYTETLTSGTVVNAYFHATTNPGAASTLTFYAGRSEVNSSSAQTQGSLIGHLGLVSVNSTAAISSAFGLQGQVSTTAAVNSPITAATGVQANINNAGTGTITTAYGVRVLTFSNSGTITTAYGLKLEDQTVGGTNFSIHTGQGTGSLGDDFTFRQVSTPSAPTIGTPTAGGSIDAGTHLWKVTYLTNTSFNRGETLLSAASASFNIVGGTQTMPLTIPVSSDGRVVARRIYRTKAGGSIYYQVGQVNDNTTTTFSDTFADSTLTLTSPALSTSVGFTGTLRSTAIYATNGRSVLEAESDLQLVLRRTNTATGAVGLTAIGDRDSAVTYCGFRINSMDASDIVAGSKYIQIQFLDAGTTGSLNISTSGVGGNTNFTDNTASTTTTTGTIVVTGGVGISGAWNAGANSTLSASSNANLLITTNNTSNGVSATARTALQNDASNTLNATIASSGNTGTIFGITTANYAYLHASGSTIAGLLIGINTVAASKPIVFGSNNVEVARFTGGTLASDSMTISYTTASTTTATGALTISGGLGVAGAGYFGNEVVAGKTYQLTGSAVSPGSTVRYIGAAGSTSTFFYNVPSGGQHIMAVADFTKLTVTSTAVTIPLSSTLIVNDVTDSTSTSSTASIKTSGGLSVALSIFATTYSGGLASACTATTQSPNNNSTAVATTAYVDAIGIRIRTAAIMRI